MVSTSTNSTSTIFSAIGIKFVLVEFVISKFVLVEFSLCTTQLVRISHSTIFSRSTANIYDGITMELQPIIVPLLSFPVMFLYN